MAATANAIIFQCYYLSIVTIDITTAAAATVGAAATTTVTISTTVMTTSIFSTIIIIMAAFEAILTLNNFNSSITLSAPSVQADGLNAGMTNEVYSYNSVFPSSFLPSPSPPFLLPCASLFLCSFSFSFLYYIHEV